MSPPEWPRESPGWKAALVTVRTQLADYEREGTSTPGKLKRSARLRACRLALRDLAATHGEAVAKLKNGLAEIERAEKDDDFRQVGDLIRRLLTELDGQLGAPIH
jgi:hypothetical protein